MKITFPSIRELHDKYKQNIKMTALEQFIFTYMPIDTDEGKAEFKRHLEALIREIKEQGQGNT